MDKIAVLIPCYNEALTIRKVIRDFRAALPEAQIYVYDNNSTDDTYEIAKAEGVVVRREPKQGKGNVMRTMFREIDAHCYLLVDGDDTYPSESANALCDEVLLNKCDMAVGDRLSSTYFTENKRPFHNFGNVLVRFLVNLPMFTLPPRPPTGSNLVSDRINHLACFRRLFCFTAKRQKSIFRSGISNYNILIRKSQVMRSHRQRIHQRDRIV